jgi:hypothetical protein
MAFITVKDVLAGYAKHPYENLIRHWNWKSAVLSACVRGSLFFATNAGAGLNAAFDAMVIESSFYATVAGFYGAMIEGFRKAQPAYAATLAVMVLMPTVNHTLELAVHRIGGTQNLAASIIASVCFSLFSAAFNLFAMRRGALIVGDERRSLIADLLRLPFIIFEFLAVIARAPQRCVSRLSSKERCQSKRFT